MGSSPTFGKLFIDIRRNKLINNGRFSSPNSKSNLVNEGITSREVRLINDQGENIGIVKTREAIEMAFDKGLDLVVVSPNQEPPVAKIMDYGKYKFDIEKRAREARKKQHSVELKEIKMRYKIDVHDYDVRIKNIKKFLHAGNKVKVVIMLKGREIQHSKLAFDLIRRVENDIKDENFIVEKPPGMEGKNVVMILVASES